jgi:hypothetical protein
MKENSPHQFYITHCQPADSVFGSAGFGIRASSTSSPRLLETAAAYPSYELPMEMWSRRPSRSEAPRRLARVNTPHGVMVVHTNYLEKATSHSEKAAKRDGNYFTHIFLLPKASALEVLKSWNAEKWAEDYQPGEPKSLDSLPLPAGTELSDESLERFLNIDIKIHRTLVTQAIRGVLMSSNDSTRNRLFIHAKPEIVALLVYAAARLLPPVLTEDLTFSTYEPAHRSLREFKQTFIVGTFLATEAKGLESDLVKFRGYCVDVVNPSRGSSELLADTNPGIGKLVELAAEGRWNVVSTIHQLCRSEPLTEQVLDKAIRLGEAIHHLSLNSEVDEILWLKSDPEGEKAIVSREKELWPRVRKLAIDGDRRVEVLRAFRSWFSNTSRVEELAGIGLRYLAEDNPKWRQLVRILCSILEDHNERRSLLVRLLDSQHGLVQSLPPASRAVLRSFVHLPIRDRRLGDNVANKTYTTADRKVLSSLFVPASDAELKDILETLWLPWWAVVRSLLSARMTMDRAMHRRVAVYLKSSKNASILGPYARVAAPYFAKIPSIADELFGINPSAESEHAEGLVETSLFDRLIGSHRDCIPPKTWMEQAKRLKYFNDASPLLLKPDRLKGFLCAIGKDPAGQAGWVWALGRATKSLDFLDSASPAHAIWSEFDLASREVWPESEPAPLFASRVCSARTLIEFTTGESVPEDVADVWKSLEQFEADRGEGLSQIFSLTCRDATPESNPAAFDRLAILFSSLYPPSEIQDQANFRALDCWLTLIADSREKSRLQEFFFESSRLSPKSSRWRLALVAGKAKARLDAHVADRVRSSLHRRQRNKWLSIAASVMVAAILLGLVVGRYTRYSRTQYDEDSSIAPLMVTQDGGKLDPIPLHGPKPTPIPSMGSPNSAEASRSRIDLTKKIVERTLSAARNLRDGFRDLLEGLWKLVQDASDFIKRIQEVLKKT